MSFMLVCLLVVVVVVGTLLGGVLMVVLVVTSPVALLRALLRALLVALLRALLGLLGGVMQVRAWLRALLGALLGGIMLVRAWLKNLVSEKRLTKKKTSQLIRFIPEECVAELTALSQQLKSNNYPTWLIKMIIFKCFLELIFAFYIQIKIDNFRLPRKKK